MKHGDLLNVIMQNKGMGPMQLAEKLGTTHQNVHSYLNTEKFRNQTLERICKALNISTEVFLSYADLPDDTKNIVSEKLQEVNEPQVEYKPIKYSRPYYDVEVFATPGVELIEDMGYIEPQGFITVPQFSNAEMYIRVSGDSMYPKYRHGDIIPVKKVLHQSFFTYYEPYVVITKTNKMRLLKYVHPHDEDDKLLLVSYDSNKFRPQAIDKEEILALYHVLGKIEL